MGIIYITGHKNPDLDSVCSAYGYARLMNLQDSDNTYLPVRCGHLSESTRSILEQLQIDHDQTVVQNEDGSMTISAGRPDREELINQYWILSGWGPYTK